jgi:glycosyltransferase involved in cell wall biosynthesis
MEKVLFITYEFDKHIGGGAGRAINGIASGLCRNTGVDVLLLRWNFLCNRFAVKFYSLGKHDLRIRVFGNYYIHVLKNLLAQSDYSIVHIFHIGKEIAMCVETIKKYFPHIKIVYSCHSISRYEINVRNNNIWELDYERNILGNADKIHLLNRTSYQYFKGAYPELAVKSDFYIIPNGIDEECFVKISDPFYLDITREIKGDSDLVVLCMSRWAHGKGLEYLLDAIPIVVRSLPKIKFVLAGRKKNSWENKVGEYVKMIDRKIGELGDNVVSLGWLDDVKRNTLFSIADIWVMPSMLEYFPYSILEPMIGRIPIVSSRIPCVEEMLSHGTDCLMYDYQDTNGLAKAVLTLAYQEDMRCEMAQAAFDKAVKLYSWERVAGMYMEMYSHAIDNKSVKNKIIELI